jgi:hypothetical protein
MAAIYHFTDVMNLRGILDSAVVRCHRLAETEVNIGNESIKRNRTLIDVGCGPGGKVCDYVPFYFAPRSPMLYSIMRGNVEGVSSNQRRLVYLVSSTEAVYEAELPCVFSDGNAGTFGLTRFNSDPEALSTHVDWSVMTLTMWNNTAADPDRMRRRMAEFLVREEVPLNLIAEIGCTTPKLANGSNRLWRTTGRSPSMSTATGTTRRCLSTSSTAIC